MRGASRPLLRESHRLPNPDGVLGWQPDLLHVGPAASRWAFDESCTRLRPNTFRDLNKPWAPCLQWTCRRAFPRTHAGRSPPMAMPRFNPQAIGMDAMRWPRVPALAGAFALTAGCLGSGGVKASQARAIASPMIVSAARETPRHVVDDEHTAISDGLTHDMDPTPATDGDTTVQDDRGPRVAPAHKGSRGW